MSCLYLPLYCKNVWIQSPHYFFSDTLLSRNYIEANHDCLHFNKSLAIILVNIIFEQPHKWESTEDRLASEFWFKDECKYSVMNNAKLNLVIVKIFSTALHKRRSAVKSEK